MRIAAKRELHKALSPVGTTGAASVLTVPFDIAVLKVGFAGLKEVASHIHS